MDVLQMIVDRYNDPDPNPYLFQVGQRVRINKGVTQDGQTPKFWDGGFAIVEKRKCGGLCKEHWYTLKHANGCTDDFREEELDSRYSRIDKK